MSYLAYSARGREIGIEAGMNPLPEQWSGRPANGFDLKDETLENFYQILQERFGDHAAQNFAQMVADIPELTATDFLLAFHALEGNNWNWSKGMIKQVINNGGVKVTNFATGIGTLCERILRQGRTTDWTGLVRDDFLARHGIEIPPYDSKNPSEQYQRRTEYFNS